MVCKRTKAEEMKEEKMEMAPKKKKKMVKSPKKKK